MVASLEQERIRKPIRCPEPRPEPVTFISKGVPRLSKSEHIQVQVPREGQPSLCVVRDGDTHAFPISKKVAAELIAAGFTYGD